MSRAEQRREAREQRRGKRNKGRHPAWILVGSAALALVLVGIVNEVQQSNDRHPTPRSEDVASNVLPDTRYATSPRVAEVYRMAATVPDVLDGIYCYCRCSEHSGHYSLRDCFASDHAAGCDVCLSEAVIAYDMTGDGADLVAIRDRIDRTYGT
jgi:Protein of unknown function with PCYCGC motif